MNKSLRIILAILIILTFVIYPARYKIGAFYYDKINPNASIKILTVDQNNIKDYNDIIRIINSNRIPSFIYFNTRFSYDRLINDTVALHRLDSLYKSDELNLVYIANGLEEETREKDKWIVMINKLRLNGIHISLPGYFPDFESFLKTTKEVEGHKSTSVPHYLLANSQNMIIDTIYEGQIDVEKIKTIIEK